MGRPRREEARSEQTAEVTGGNEEEEKPSLTMANSQLFFDNRQ
jgi:hypothetical protein